jgi:outer membrane autotransporter protein
VPGHELLFASTIEDVVESETSSVVTGAMTVSDNIPLWQFDAVNDGEFGIDLVVSGDAENVVTSTGPSWAIGAASGIDSVVDGEYGEDMSDVIAELAQITSDEELAAAVAQFVPVLIGRSVDQANLSLSGLSTLVMNRMDTHRAMTEDASHDQNFWIRGFGTSGQQDDDSDYPGYDSESYGFVIGYDMAVGGAWNVGAAFGYAQPELELDESVLQHEIDSDAYQGALYGYWESESETFVDLMGVYGVNQNDSSRMIAFGDILRTAEADYDTTYWRLSGAVGHDFPLSDSVTLTPIASIAYTYVEDDSYTESGADDLNLNVESVDAESLITALDLRLAFEVMENGFLTAHVGGGYDSMTDDIVVGSTFVGGGDPWRTAGPEPEETMLRAGAGAEFSVSDAIDVHVNYEYENRDTWENNLVTATMRWTF